MVGGAGAAKTDRPFADLFGRHKVAKTKAREEELRVGSDVGHHAGLVQRPERLLRLTEEAEVDVAVVFDDRNTVVVADVDDLLAAPGREGRTGRVLVLRDCVEKAGLVARRGEAGEQLFQRLRDKTVVVDWRSNDGASGVTKLAQGSAVHESLRDDGAPGVGQRQDQAVVRFAGAGADKHVFRVHGEPAVSFQFLCRELAKRQVSVGVRVVNEVMAFTLQPGDQTLHQFIQRRRLGRRVRGPEVVLRVGGMGDCRFDRVFGEST